MSSDNTMNTRLDLYDGRYFHIQKKLLTFIGAWPYHPKRKFAYCLWLMLVIVLSGPQILALKVNFHDPGKIMEHTVMLLVQFTIFSKLLTVVISEKNMKLLYDRIVENWTIITDPEEKDILIEYSERGRLLTIGYICLQTPVFVVFSFVPLIPVILDVISPQSVPRSKISILHGEYLLKDPDSYYLFTSFWEMLQVFCVLAMAAPIDVIYSSSTEHCLGLHAIIKHRLFNLKSTIDRNVDSKMKHESVHQMVEIIKLHEMTLQSTATLEEGYSLCFFLMICLHLVVIPLISVLILQSLENPINLFRYVLFLTCALVHLFNIFWPGQKLINHSDEILDAAVCNEWYTCSIASKRMLNLYMSRCLQPPLLTGGGIMLLNFENYFIIVKTAASYITVFASFR